MRAFAGVEVLWILLIVASIIARVIKAAKEQKPGKESSPESAGDYKASSSDLKDFLESLSGAKQVRPSAGANPPKSARGQIAPARRTAKRSQAQKARPPVQAPARQVAPPVAPPRSVAPPPRPRAVAPAPQRQERPAPVPAPQTTTPVKPSPVKSTPKEMVTTVKFAGTKQTNRMSREILNSLRDIDSTRKAIVLREILGPPVALTK